MNNIDEIIKKLSQSDYTFGNGELTPAEVRQIKQQSKNSRGTYGVNASVGTNIFSFIAQNDDIVLEKELGDVLLDGTNIILPLSQEDTLKFIVGTATIQIRLRDINGNALASNPMYIQVEKIYKDGVI